MAAPPVDETTPQFRNIHIRNIVCKGAARAILLQGLPEMNLENINFENVVIEAATGMYCKDAKNIRFSGFTVSTPAKTVIHMENAKNISISGMEFARANEKPIRIEGALTSEITVSGKGLNSQMVEVSPSVKAGEVIISGK
jgi:DNA sulfur modification protein DndE